MKPLKINHNFADGTEMMMFVRPDTIKRVYSKQNRTFVITEDDITFEQSEPLLDFVSRWEEALADSTPIYIVDSPKVGGSPNYGKPNFERGVV